MKPFFVGIGLTMVAAAGVLSSIGHYDGVLGTTDPDSLLSPETTQAVTLRVVVKETTDQASQRFDGFRSQLVMPDAMQTMMEAGPYVLVQVRPGFDAFLRLADYVPGPGTVLVVTGTVHTYWPMVDTGAKLVNATPIVFIDPSEYHSPILFKP